MKFLQILLTVSLIFGEILADDDIRSGTRTTRSAVRPRGNPETVQDAEGRVKRRSRVDLRGLALTGYDRKTVDIQLMNDQDAETFSNMTRDDTDQDPFESWSDFNFDTGRSLTMVKHVTADGRSVTTGTLYGNNGTVYQIRQLADRDVIVEEVPQSSFDKEYEGEILHTEGAEQDVDPTTIDEVDSVTGQGQSRRKLDSSDQIDIMVGGLARGP